MQSAEQAEAALHFLQYSPQQTGHTVLSASGALFGIYLKNLLQTRRSTRMIVEKKNQSVV
jgi:hypothetical protein